MVKVTKHAEKRLKERGGLNKQAIQRMADKAYTEGITHAQTKGNLNKWITTVFFTNTNINNIRLYGDKAYLFAGSTLVTVLQIPNSLTRNLSSMIKD